MERSGDNRTVPTEHSSPSPLNSSGRRPRRHERQRSRKKRKVLSSETETRVQIQTLKPDSTRMFSSYSRRRTNSYVQKQGRSRKKPRKPQCQRKWTYSTHDVSNCNDRFVIVSYNILGVENATKHPELQVKLFFSNYFIVNALFLKFQEVDHFNDLKEILGSDGFRGLHKVCVKLCVFGCSLALQISILTTLVCLGSQGSFWVGGCAIFWKTEQFTLLHEESIEFQRFGLRNNVAQFCVLKDMFYWDRLEEQQLTRYMLNQQVYSFDLFG
ncbi:UNVERIFIED_CONTAM: Carbon catabolite repressor protein 45 [Sesamum latifolium]|uniref:Carbon catabolite repressor protein 45 n=1 Tax=Sesamum latifolium TaxID=2727402 RepID=A0AAW2UF75_9LAMI